MKIRKTSAGVDKVEMQMTPMIDIVFQLLTFFLFSFKIASVEGDFNIRMPVATAAANPDQAPINTIVVRLAAGPDGELSGMQMNERNVDFSQLHNNIISIIGSDRGPDSAADTTEVELDCDYNLKYDNVVKAITAISGYIDDGQVIRLVSKIRFAPAKRPPGK